MLIKLKNKFTKKRFVLIFLFLIVILVVLPFSLYYLVHVKYESRIFSNIKLVPNHHAALVLGAGLDNGRPSPILYDRIKTAVNLYKAGKVKKLIMSGDNSYSNYNEADTMIKTAVFLGVPLKDIQPDYAGRRTYDSCFRTKSIFSQTDILIVTQSFHMTRSLFICNNSNINSDGFISDIEIFPWYQWDYWQIRDIYALIESFSNVFLFHPSPIGGEKIQI